MVPRSPAARQSLTAYLAVRDRFLATRGPTGGKGARAVKVASPWLFPSRGAEGHLTRHRVAQLLKDLARQAGIASAKVSPPVLPPAFASHLLDHGARLRPLPKKPGGS